MMIVLLQHFYGKKNFQIAKLWTTPFIDQLNTNVHWKQTQEIEFIKFITVMRKVFLADVIG
jgi:hypothetical protein